MALGALLDHQALLVKKEIQETLGRGAFKDPKDHKDLQGLRDLEVQGILVCVPTKELIVAVLARDHQHLHLFLLLNQL
jgi:hypothetical protein